MADTYVDLTNGSDVSDGLTWANAKVTMQAGMTAAGATGRTFVQIDTSDVATTKDTASGARTLLWLGTDQAAQVLYGVKNGTTAEPPTDSDLCVRGTDALPVFESTGGGAILVDEATANAGPQITAQGIRFDADADIDGGAFISHLLTDCELDFDGLLDLQSKSFFTYVNCDLIFFDSATNIKINDGTKLVMIGGLLSGVAPTIFIDDFPDGQVEIYGMDLSLVTGTLLDIGTTGGGLTKIANCKMGTAVTRLTGTPRNFACTIELIGSSDETGLGSGESVRDYAKESYRGTVLSEATFIRTSGANDGVAGFSYALTPRAASTQESILSLVTSWFGGLVEGDASTSKDFTIHIANSSGSDLTKADVWVEILYPSEAGTTDHGFDISSRTAIDASAADVTDDTASDWSTGAGGKNAQKIVIAKTPDFTGPVYARVHFAQAGTNTLYVDPKVYVTDT